MSKKNRKRGNGDAGEQQRNNAEEKKEPKADEDVILIGAPNKDAPTLPLKTEKAHTADAPRSAGPKEEKREKREKEAKKTEVKEKKETKTPETVLKESTSPRKEHTNLGKMFLWLLVLLLVYLVAGQIFGLFGPTTIAFYSLWPLLLILVGLSLFKIRRRSWQTMLGGIVVLFIFLFAVGAVFKTGDIARIRTAGVDIMQERSVGTFTDVVFEGTGTLSVREGGEAGVTLTADEAIMDEIKTEVRNGVLHIGYANSLWDLFLYEKTRFDAEVVTDDIRTVKFLGTGGGHVSQVSGDTLELDVVGEGTFDLADIDVGDLIIRISGKGDVVAAGQATREFIVLSGEGAYDGLELASDETAIRISGSGNVSVHTLNELNVSINGEGYVVYRGDPAITHNEVSGKGSVLSEDEANSTLSVTVKEEEESDVEENVSPPVPVDESVPDEEQKESDTVENTDMIFDGLDSILDNP